MQDKLERDLKSALLQGDKEKAEILKGVKNALIYEAVAKNLERQGLEDELVQQVIAREAKKRQEAADLYTKAGETERAAKELREKEVLSQYLPEQMTEEQVSKIIEEEASKLDQPTIKDMGRLIGAVKAKAGNSADGALVAKLVKEKLGQ